MSLSFPDWQMLKLKKIQEIWWGWNLQDELVGDGHVSEPQKLKTTRQHEENLEWGVKTPTKTGLQQQ